jgi:ribulose-phosphate 3-epimerase
MKQEQPSKWANNMGINSPKLTASLLCADFLDLGKDMRALEEAKIDYVHVDMADGHFVPLLGIGIEEAKQVRAATRIPLDVHLLVSNPDDLVPQILDSLSPAIVTFHIEASSQGYLLAQTIRGRGCMAGVALNPATPLSSIEYLLPELDVVLVMTTNPGITGQRLIDGMIEKIADLRDLIATKGRDVHISVDGNVSFDHAPRMVEAGADLLVCGSSSIFAPGHGGVVAATAAFRQSLIAKAACSPSNEDQCTGASQ